MALERGTISEYRYIKLTFNNLSASILYARGCNIIEFKDLATDCSFLHTPSKEELEEFQEAPQRFGSAILFHPNRLSHECFTRDGHTYNYEKAGLPPSHGLLRFAAFTVEEEEETNEYQRVKCSFNSKGTLYDTAFHWKFICNMAFTLDSHGLTSHMEFFNIGDVPIPFGLGFHTAFQIPSHPSSSSKEVSCKVSVTNSWTDYGKCTKWGCGTRLFEIPEESITIMDPLKESIAIPYTDYKDQCHHAIIEDENLPFRLIYETDPQFKHWMIWNNGCRGGYICIEPMTWMIDAPNSPLPDHLSGFSYLERGKPKSFTNRFLLEPKE